MRIPLFFFKLIFLCVGATAFSQVTLTEANPVVTVNFTNSMQATVGTNTYNGTGFSPTPIAGRLNSAAWETTGWQNGSLLFGAPMSNPAHGRGPVAGGVVTEGIYAFTNNPASVANPTMLIQASDADFSSGTIALKIKNNGTTNLTQLEVSYNLFVRNDQDRSMHFNFSHSADNVVYEAVDALNYTTPGPLDNFQWVAVDVAPSRSTIISGLNIAPGGVYYIRWSAADAGGSGEWDEIGLDDIMITASYGPPAPEINIIGSSALTIVNNDLTPSIGDGTLFANTYLGASISVVTYTIQNLGGAPLNISNVQITGVNAADFTILGAVPTGVIPGVAAVISKKELAIKFQPGAAGVRTAMIEVYSNDANENPYRFRVEGKGVTPQPDIEVSGNIAPNTSLIFTTSMIPNTNNSTLFPEQVVNGPGVVRGYKIKNTGTASQLVLTNPSPYITIGGNNPGDFILETIPTSNTMIAGQTRTFSIRFSPTAAGIRSAVVTIPNNDVIPDVFGNAEGPFTFLIQGNGIAPEIDITGNSQPIVSGSITPSIVNHTFFDYLNIGTGMLDRTFTIKNSGTAALELGGLSIIGSGDFSIVTPPATSIAAGTTSTFTVRYDPSLVGVSDATVNIVTNDSNENPYTFAIRGYGVDYIPCTNGVVETIAIQDFEATPMAPVWAYTTTGVVNLAGGVGFAVSGDGGLTNRFLGARSLQVPASTAAVIMDVKNTTQYSDIELTLSLSSLSVTALEGNDLTDRVIVSVSTNGGITWSSELQVTGSTNAKWSFASGSGIASTPYDGNNLATSFVPATSNFLTTDGYGSLSVTGLPRSASLQIRIALNNNTNEIWAIDNVALFGRRELSTVWNGTAWSNGVPNASIKAVLNGNYNTSTGNITACKCEILAGRTLTVNTNQFVDVQSDLVNNGGQVIVENGGSIVQRNDYAVNSGNATIKRNTTPMRLFDYTYWSSPVGTQVFNVLSPNTLPDKYLEFNTVGNNWQSVSGGSIMSPGKGYIIRAPQNFTTTPVPYNGVFAGTPNNGIVTSPVFTAVSEYNLLGNPYPSAIDADLFLAYSSNVTKLAGTIYFWTHNTPVSGGYSSNDYAMYNLLGGVGTAATSPGVSTNIPTGNIASGQGFFVKAVGAGLATFTNSMRITGNNMEFFRTASTHDTGTASNEIEKHRIWLNLRNSNGAFKQTLIGYATGATLGLDRDFDGTILNGGNAVSLYSLADSHLLAIQGRPVPFTHDDVVPLGYSTTIAGTYSISIDGKDGVLASQPVFLRDKLSNVIHDLTLPYEFTTASGAFNSRFELLYTNAALSIDDMIAGTTRLSVAVNNGSILIRSLGEMIAQVQVFDLLGRVLYNKTAIEANDTAIDNVVSSNQALLVKVTLNDDTVVAKKIIF